MFESNAISIGKLRVQSPSDLAQTPTSVHRWLYHSASFPANWLQWHESEQQVTGHTNDCCSSKMSSSFLHCRGMYMLSPSLSSFDRCSHAHQRRRCKYFVAIFIHCRARQSWLHHGVGLHESMERCMSHTGIHSLDIFFCKFHKQVHCMGEAPWSKTSCQIQIAACKAQEWSQM